MDTAEYDINVQVDFANPKQLKTITEDVNELGLRVIEIPENNKTMFG